MELRVIDRLRDVYPNQKFVTVEGLDDAVMGLDLETMRLVYSVSSVVNIFVQRGMTVDEAEEFFAKSVLPLDFGYRGPIWCDNLLC